MYIHNTRIGTNTSEDNTFGECIYMYSAKFDCNHVWDIEKCKYQTLEIGKRKHVSSTNNPVTNIDFYCRIMQRVKPACVGPISWIMKSKNKMWLTTINYNRRSIYYVLLHVCRLVSQNNDSNRHSDLSRAYCYDAAIGLHLCKHNAWKPLYLTRRKGINNDLRYIQLTLSIVAESSSRLYSCANSLRVSPSCGTESLC